MMKRLSYIVLLVTFWSSTGALAGKSVADRYLSLRGETYRLVRVDRSSFFGDAVRHELSRRRWRRILGVATGVSLAALTTFGVMAVRAGIRLSDSRTVQVDVPGLQRSRDLNLIGVGVSAGIAAASLVGWFLLRKPAEDSKTRWVLAPTGLGIAGGVKF